MNHQAHYKADEISKRVPEIAADGKTTRECGSIISYFRRPLQSDWSMAVWTAGCAARKTRAITPLRGSFLRSGIEPRFFKNLAAARDGTLCGAGDDGDNRPGLWRLKPGGAIWRARLIGNHV